LEISLFFCNEKIVINNKHYFSNTHAALQQCQAGFMKYLRRSFGAFSLKTAPQVLGRLPACVRGWPVNPAFNDTICAAGIALEK
jgi:hypothetical protein